MVVNKRLSFGSAIHYLKGRPATLKRYLQKYYTPYDWEFIERFFYDNPIQARVILNDFVKSNDAKLEEVVKMFIYGKSKIVYIVGARGSGKTATTFMFAEQVNNQTNRPVFYVSPDVDKNLLPNWMKTVNSINDVPQGSFAIIDESALQYNARRSMSDENVDLGKQLAIARHREIFLIFITQHTAMADKNIKRLKDMVLWKQSNDYAIGEGETRSTKEHKFWGKVRNMMAPRSKSECLFEYPSQKRFIHFSHGLADCWTESLSKSWKDTQTTKKKEDEIIIKKQINNPRVIKI